MGILLDLLTTGIPRVRGAWAAALLGCALWAGAPPPDPGERIYREGILPSGQPLRASAQAGRPVPGTSFSCASCHWRSGIPPMEEGSGVRVRAIDGQTLFQPLYLHYPNLTPAERAELVPARWQYPPIRPAYTEATLVQALRQGVDPQGRVLHPSMPRYDLSDADAGLLVGYLKQLSTAPSPGVTDTTIAFATVLTEEVPAKDREAMLLAIQQAFETHNHLLPNPALQMGRMLNMQVMGLGYRQWTLTPWLLQGAPETWPEQLEGFYAREKVFALVGGISTRNWEPVERFCEANRLPCILPITDLPGTSGRGYYTVHYSRGLFQEGAAVARYLAGSLGRGRLELAQVLDASPEAAALAEGFRSAWSGPGRPPPRSLTLRNGAPLTGPALSGLLKTRGNAVLLLWTGAEAFPALEALARAKGGPPRVFMSSTRIGEALWDLPAAARGSTLIAYPYRRPGRKELLPLMGARQGATVDKEYRVNDRRIGSRMQTALQLLNECMVRMDRRFLRDYLLDSIDAEPVGERSDYELLNFGPGQRYLSEGCHIVRVQEGPEPGLLPGKDWTLY